MQIETMKEILVIMEVIVAAVINESSITLSNNISPREKDLEEMLDGMKQLFHSFSKNYPERIKLLTLVPLSWSIRKQLKSLIDLDILQKLLKNNV